ncbi:MAG: histidine phosphatase family protein [Solirubrobacteraceae bacterium]
MPASRLPEVVLVRHGETEWSRSGQHTGRTDLELTAHGREEAEEAARKLGGRPFVAVLSSPLRRARETARIAGHPDPELTDDLREWDYGDYEGLTTAQIRADRPGWTLWRDGCPGGEDAAAVGARVDRVIERLRGLKGDAAVFAHGHVLRVFGARWAGLPPQRGSILALSTATVSVLGYERETPVLWSWNDGRPVDGSA